VSNNSRGVVMGVAIVLVVVVAVLFLGKPSGRRALDPESYKPSGTRALITLTRELGANVQVDVRDLHGLGDGTDVVLVLRDRLSDDQRARLMRWVRDGGTVVAVDPASPLTPPVTGLDGTTGDPADFAVDEAIPVRAGHCDIAALDDPDAARLQVYGGPVYYQVQGNSQSCFGGTQDAYVVATPEGRGTVVAIGGSGILLNRSLGKSDNAPVIAALLAPHSGIHVAVLDPFAPIGAHSGDEGLIDLISPGVKRALLQLGVAFLVFVLWRSRRLGAPVEEPQPVAVAGSELVSAVGGLLQRSGSPQHAADLLRAELRRDLGSRLGLPPRLPSQTYVEVVAARTQLDPARIAAAIEPTPVNNDGDLLAVAQLVDAIRKEVFDHVGS
jgi:hypothetical protein